MLWILIVDDEFLTIFLAFYRKFAAPSKFLQSLIAKYEEASRSALDYMLQMIVQTRYPPYTPTPHRLGRPD